MRQPLLHLGEGGVWNVNGVFVFSCQPFAYRYATVSEGAGFECHLNCDKVKVRVLRKNSCNLSYTPVCV